MTELSDIQPGGTFTPPKMKPLNGAQWQQVPLFNVKPTDENRYPRGYTPERMHRVDRLMPPVTVATKDASYWNKSAADSAPARDGYMVSNENQITTARHRMIDTVSRSSLDTNDLSGLRHIMVGDPGSNYGPSKGADGTYHSRDAIIKMSARAKTAETENTLIHEIGHHADYRADPKLFNERGAASRGASPELEGYAVGYAHAHTPVRGNDPLDHMAYDQFHKKPGFQQHFYRASGQMVGEAKAEIERSRTTAPAHDVTAISNQRRLFGRNADRFFTETEKDHGQWGYFDMTGDRETELPSIRLGGGAPANPHDRLQAGVTPANYDTGLSIQNALHNTDSAIRHARGDETGGVRQPQHKAWPK